MRLTRVAQEFYCMFYCSCANPFTDADCAKCHVLIKNRERIIGDQIYPNPKGHRQS